MKYGIWLAIGLLLCPSGALAAQTAGTVEASVKTLMVDPRSQSPVVVLESVADKKLLPIWIDVAEARAIALELKRVKAPRPLTHDLMRDILTGLGATLERVIITDLRDNIYYALLHLRLKGQEFQIDARPSDAIALAVRMKARIFASSLIFDASKAMPTRQSANEIQRRLGIQTQDLTAELAALFDVGLDTGVLVADVEPAGAAAAAGIRRGDIITKANHSVIRSAAELEAITQALRPPARIKLEVIRKGKMTDLTIDLNS